MTDLVQQIQDYGNIEKSPEEEHLNAIKRLYSQEIQFDNFDVIKVIGRGSYAKVYLIRKGSEGPNAEFYALKVLKKKSLFDKNLLHHTL